MLTIECRDPTSVSEDLTLAWIYRCLRATLRLEVCWGMQCYCRVTIRETHACLAATVLIGALTQADVRKESDEGLSCGAEIQVESSGSPGPTVAVGGQWLADNLPQRLAWQRITRVVISREGVIGPMLSQRPRTGVITAQWLGAIQRS